MNRDQTFYSKMSTRFLSLVMLLLIFNCTFHEPNEPVWEVELFIPFIDKLWTMEELTKDIKELSIDMENEQLLLTFDKELNLHFQEQFLQVSIESRGGSSTQYPKGVQTLDSLRVFTSGFLVQEPTDINRGTLKLLFSNPDPTNDIFIHLELLDLLEPDGVTHPEFDVQVGKRPPGKTYAWEEINLDLQNYIFSPPVHNGENYFRFRVHPTGSTTVNTGGFSVAPEQRSFFLQSVTVELGQAIAQFDEVEIDEPIPEEFKDMSLQTVELKVPLSYNVPMPFNFFLSIQAVNPRKGVVTPITVDKRYEATPVGVTMVDTIIIPQVAGFINSNPKIIEISGNVQLGDGTEEVTFTSDNTIEAGVIFEIPLIMKLPVDTSTTQIDTVEIEEDERDAIRDNLNQLFFDASLENHTPIAAEVYLLFSKTYGDSTLYNHPADLTVGPIRLAQATLTGNPAVVSQASEATWTQEFTKEEIKLFSENEQVYVGTRIVFLGTAEQIAKFTPTDYLKAFGSLRARVSTKISEDDE
jgi:hypothetical protein